MEKPDGEPVGLIQHFQLKIKIFLAKCNDRHPVILRITLAVLAALSFTVFFKVCFGLDLMNSCKLTVLVMPLIYIHERGHVWARKKCGIAVWGIFFVPFMGAVTLSKRNPNCRQILSRAAEAFIYIMGPIWGLVLTVIAAGAYFLTGIRLFADIAIWSVFLNLLNLVPLVPMDGGRIIKAISFSIRPWFGFGLTVIVIIAAFVFSCLYIQEWIGRLIVCLVLMLPIRDFRREYALRENTDRRPMSWKMIVFFTFAYLASIAVFCGIIYLILF